MIAVTGAGGFIGGHLVAGLRARGMDVLPILRTVCDGAPEGARTLEDVLAEPPLLEGAVVIHCAAIRHRHGVASGTYRQSNVDLVTALLRACAGRVRRFVYVSSVGVYGFPSRLPIDEQSPFSPVTAYSESKVEAERLVNRLAPELGVEATIVRPTIVYGPGDKNGMLDKLVRMIDRGTYAIVGDGQNVLHHTHVDDLVEGIALAAQAASAAGEDFILAGPETTTLRRLSELVAAALGKRIFPVHVPLRVARGVASVVDAAQRAGVAFTSREPPINHEKLDVMTRPIAFDISKARRVLGYDPHVRYEKGVAETVHRTVTRRST
jgi:nucleoside-diphosphate-sugar epimerase